MCVCGFLFFFRSFFVQSRRHLFRWCKTGFQYFFSVFCKRHWGHEFPTCWKFVIAIWLYALLLLHILFIACVCVCVDGASVMLSTNDDDGWWWWRQFNYCLKNNYIKLHIIFNWIKEKRWKCSDKNLPVCLSSVIECQLANRINNNFDIRAHRKTDTWHRDGAIVEPKMNKMYVSIWRQFLDKHLNCVETTI